MAEWRYTTSMTQRQTIVFVCVSSLMIIIDNAKAACSSSCSSCVNDECEGCLNGNYLGNTGECITCPDRCTACYNEDYCYNCTAGYFGKTCTHPCMSPFCVTNECDINNGYYTSGCTKGYFQKGPKCYPCESTCKTCVNVGNNCTQCTEGHYGPGCQFNCSHCKDSLCSKDRCTNGCGDGYYRGSETCSPCNTGCTSCSTFKNCYACKDGYWGSHCRYTCTECIPCNKNDGSCVFKPPATSSRSTSTIERSKEGKPITERNPTGDTTVTYTLTTSDTKMTTEPSSTFAGVSKDKCNISGVLYAVVIGWILLALHFGVDILVAVVVYRRRVIAGQGHTPSVAALQSGQSSTTHDYLSLDMRTRGEDENQYSTLNNSPQSVNMPTVSTSTTSRMQGENAREGLHDKQYGGSAYDGLYINT